MKKDKDPGVMTVHASCVLFESRGSYESMCEDCLSDLIARLIYLRDAKRVDGDPSEEKEGIP